MIDFGTPQNASLNGIPYRIQTPRHFLPASIESSAQIRGLLFSTIDSPVSPPLSDIELEDIEASEREFLTMRARVFENAEEFINELHAERLRFIRENEE